MSGGLLEGRTAIVTGATSGIGAAVARRFVSEGSQVVCVGRSDERGRSLVAELGDSRAAFVQVDLTEPEAPARVIERTLGRFGSVDVLVNNAAMDYVGPLTEAPQDEIELIMRTNLIAPIRMLQHAVTAMGDEGGAIVNVVSRLAVIGVPKMVIYGASKGGLLSFTRGAAIELAPLGIRVNAVAPGQIRTPLTEAWLDGEEDRDAAYAAAVRGVPQGRLGEAEEVADVIVFLASDHSSHVTGASVPVDGGYTSA